MAKWENSVLVERSPEAVFAFILAPEHAPQWHVGHPTMEKITDGKEGVGTRYRLVMPKGQRETITEITDFEANRRVTFTSVTAPMPLVISYHLEPVDDGTRLTEVGELTLRGLFRLIAPLSMRAIKANNQQGLARLKIYLEDNV